MACPVRGKAMGNGYCGKWALKDKYTRCRMELNERMKAVNAFGI